jgi:hypothetical protein
MKVIDLPADDPRRRFIDAAIDRQITEALTPERVFAVLQCALSKRDDGGSDESRKLCKQITLQVRKALVPKDEIKTDADVEKWVEIIFGRFRPLLTGAVWKEFDAAVATGRVSQIGDGKFRVRPPSELKSRCRTKTKNRRPQ